MTRRVAVLMIIDGLRGDMVTPELSPALCEIAGRSRIFTAHRSVFPSATRVNAASIATGCLPARHGLPGNAIALDEGNGLVAVSVGPPEFRERWRRATGRTLHRPALPERLGKRGGAVIYSNSSAGAAHMLDPDGHGHLFHRSGCFAPGLRAIKDARFAGIGYDGAGDAEVTGHFCDTLMKDRESDLFILWICEPDHSQHALELGSPAHRKVLAGADACAGRVSRAVASRREAGDDVLFVLGSDHGHETVAEIVPVEELLESAGLGESRDSNDIVFASSGMGALLYFSAPAAGRRGALAAWLRAQPWTDEVFEGEKLAAVGLPTGTALGIAIAMAKREGANRFGVPGLGCVAADAFTSGDRVGFGQHGGLGAYETRPFLIADGSAFPTGRSGAPSATTDIAPTLLHHLDAPGDGMDGRSLLPG